MCLLDEAFIADVHMYMGRGFLLLQLYFFFFVACVVRELRVSGRRVLCVFRLRAATLSSSPACLRGYLVFHVRGRN